VAGFLKTPTAELWPPGFPVIVQVSETGVFDELYVVEGLPVVVVVAETDPVKNRINTNALIRMFFIVASVS